MLVVLLPLLPLLLSHIPAQLRVENSSGLSTLLALDPFCGGPGRAQNGAKRIHHLVLAGQFSRTRFQIFQLATRSGLMIPDMKERKRNNAQPGWFWGTLPMLSSDFCLVVFRNNFMGFKYRGSLRVRGMSLHRWHPSFFRRCRRRTPRVYQRRWVSEMPVIWFLSKCDEMESSWTLHF